MSSKKNKAKNKSHKPNIVLEVDEKNENKEETTSPAINKIESLPEPPKIESEIITTTQTSEVKENVDESPKKPKRHKNKKKKQEENVQDSELQQPEAKTSDIIEVRVVSPTNPSKKKQNKNQSQETQKVNEPSTELFVENIKPGSLKMEDVKIINCEVIDVKSGKNKNKKKKRTDSDKSDNAEELSCTAAFERILLPKTEEKDKNLKEEIKQDNLKTTLPQQDSAINKGNKGSDHDPIKPTEEGKNKKKNKKEKKSPLLEDKIEEVEEKVATETLNPPSDEKIIVNLEGQKKDQSYPIEFSDVENKKTGKKTSSQDTKLTEKDKVLPDENQSITPNIKDDSTQKPLVKNDPIIVKDNKEKDQFSNNESPEQGKSKKKNKKEKNPQISEQKIPQQEEKILKEMQRNPPNIIEEDPSKMDVSTDLVKQEKDESISVEPSVEVKNKKKNKKDKNTSLGDETKKQTIINEGNLTKQECSIGDDKNTKMTETILKTENMKTELTKETAVEKNLLVKESGNEENIKKTEKAANNTLKEINIQTEKKTKTECAESKKDETYISKCITEVKTENILAVSPEGTIDTLPKPSIDVKPRQKKQKEKNLEIKPLEETQPISQTSHTRDEKEPALDTKPNQSKKESTEVQVKTVPDDQVVESKVIKSSSESAVTKPERNKKNNMKDEKDKNKSQTLVGPDKTQDLHKDVSSVSKSVPFQMMPVFNQPLDSIANLNQLEKSVQHIKEQLRTSDKIVPAVEKSLKDEKGINAPGQKSTSTPVKTEECLFKAFPEEAPNKNISGFIEDLLNEFEGKELTPDIIESPRSTSADISDKNNNMFIQEIASISSLSVPISIPETPLVSDSKLANSPTNQDLVTPGIRVAGLETITEKQQISETPRIDTKKTEATDLKSKVLEVNKDMEDLRKSIEKSLAEFASLEKEEKLLESAMSPTESAQQLKIPETKKEIQPASIGSENNIEVPTCPSRKDHRGKNKSKKKEKQDSSQIQSTTTSTTTHNTNTAQDSTQTSSTKQDKKETQNKSKNQTSDNKSQAQADDDIDISEEFEPIEKFEDAVGINTAQTNIALEKNADDILNKKHIDTPHDDHSKNEEQKGDSKNSTGLHPKNLLGHPDIPVRSNKTDYKKEKNKPPNEIKANVRIKDSEEVEKKKESKKSQTENRPRIKSLTSDSVKCVTSENDEYIYKYSFRKVFLPSNCHVCMSDLKDKRVPCNFCNLSFYCSPKHKQEDLIQHQPFCFAVATVAHIKGQKHVYADIQGLTGHNYRLVRMQAIMTCEKALKRKLHPYEQEMLLYPRICADSLCREYKQSKLADCTDCGQISYCADNPSHLVKSHTRWCKSYALYKKLVVHQLTYGRLEPKLPTKQLSGEKMSGNINRLLADMFDEKIDMNDKQYAALTQLASAPMTAAYAYQLYSDKMKAVENVFHKNSKFTIHIVGAELQFEADSLNKWETFFLHLRPDIEDLRVVLISTELNPSNLPLDLLGKIKLCASCRLEKRKLEFDFQDKKTYFEYYDSHDFIKPDIVCAYHPSINRSSMYDSTWASTLNCIFKLKSPFLVTSYTMSELQRDTAAIKNMATTEFNFVSEAKFNSFASVRPDRNFITDDEMPLLFKNYCDMVLIGAF